MAHRIPEKQAPLAPLRVLSRGTAIVSDYRALMEARVNRKVGWRFNGSLGPEFQDTSTGQTKRHGARVKSVDDVFVVQPDDPFRGEYVKHVQQGDLWAADPETAAACGVAFEPHFGGEHPKTSASHGLDGAKLAAKLKECGLGDLPDASNPLGFDTAFKPKVATEPSKVAATPAK